MEVFWSALSSKWCNTASLQRYKNPIEKDKKRTGISNLAGAGGTREKPGHIDGQLSRTSILLILSLILLPLPLAVLRQN